MLNVDYLYVLSALLELGERHWAKVAASRIIAMADMSELWTIAQCAGILDGSNKLAVGKARLDRFARELNDEHRAALVRFCRDETGARPRRTLTNPEHPLFGLSVQHDTRPGYDERDAQPAELTVYPEGYEDYRRHQRNAAMAAMARDLRTTKRQLPAHVRTQLRATKHTRPERRRPPRTAAEQRAAQEVARYAATRLNREDHTAEGMRTIFDVDDDKHRWLIAPRVMQARIAQIRAQIKARTMATEALAEADAFTDATDQAPTVDQPRTPHPRNTEISDPTDGPHVILPGYQFDYDKAAKHPLRTTPCVSCWTERRPQDVRTIARANGYDDSLCGECRESGHTGLPKPRPIRRTVAYLSPADRAEAARTAALTAPCATAAANLPKGAALVWIRAYRALTSKPERATIDEWVLAWLSPAQPQPPTTPAPAAAERVLVAA